MRLMVLVDSLMIFAGHASVTAFLVIPQPLPGWYFVCSALTASLTGLYKVFYIQKYGLVIKLDVDRLEVPLILIKSLRCHPGLL